MEGVQIFEDEQMSQEDVLLDLKSTLEGLAHHLFGQDIDCRWNADTFPFTDPSLELEIRYENEWLEVLGCGVMKPSIVAQGGHGSKKAWAFGLGLERLAMVLFGIPDIRLFWSNDARFLSQFEQKVGDIKFQPYSKYPPCFKDVSFWITDPETFHVHDLLDVTRQLAGDLVETVELVDQFIHPKTQTESQCYRITYRSMDRSLTNAEIDALQHALRQTIQDTLPVALR
jgi:phenylalanyl-tRNA synthetase alpha chain